MYSREIRIHKKYFLKEGFCFVSVGGRSHKENLPEREIRSFHELNLIWSTGYSEVTSKKKIFFLIRLLIVAKSY